MESTKRNLASPQKSVPVVKRQTYALAYSVKDHPNSPKHSPLLKKVCVRQVVLDKWFPLTYIYICIYMYTHISIYLSIYLSISLSASLSLSLPLSLYIYIYIYIHTHYAPASKARACARGGSP